MTLNNSSQPYVELLDIDYYRAANPDLAGLDEIQTAAHFQKFGLDEGRSFSPLVDLDFYRSSYADLAEASNREAFEHLQNFGMAEGRSFSPFVDLDLYRFSSLDLAGKTNARLFQHLRDFGIAEGRRFSAVFEADFYRNANLDLALASLNNQQLWEHFQRFGINEGRKASEFFDVSYYRANNPELAAAILDDRDLFKHFVRVGLARGDNASGSFDSNFYLARNPDIAAAIARREISNSLVHFIAFGRGQGQTGTSDGFNIEFDYRFDTNGFFSAPEKRAILEAAAAIWEETIANDFRNIPAGTPVSVRNPQTGAIESFRLNADIDDILIFVGASSPPNSDPELEGDLAFGEVWWPGDEAGTIVRQPRNGTNLEPWLGSISFNINANWFFDPTLASNEDIPSDRFDFLSVALHEIGHVLGIGTTDIFKTVGAGGFFRGANALAINGGEPIPLESNLEHIQDGFTLGGDVWVLMDSLLVAGTRKMPTEVDLAILADLGYEISGFQASGSTPSLTSEGDDLIFGTNRAEIIYGLGGNDQLQGNDGGDWLYGGEGSDTIFGATGSDALFGSSGGDWLIAGIGNDLLLGEAGNDELQGNAGDDWLYGGEGDDRLFGQEGSDRFRFDAESGNDTIGDFLVAEDRIEVAAGLGFSSGAELLAAIATSANPAIDELFSSVLTLSPGNSITIFHQQPLTEANFTVR